jgi:hypothetical protein
MVAFPEAGFPRLHLNISHILLFVNYELFVKKKIAGVFFNYSFLRFLYSAAP